MPTTTVRVDSETHQKLRAMSDASGASLLETLRDAAEALRRQRFANHVTQELEQLREDEPAWEAYLAEAESTSVSDGLR